MTKTRVAVWRKSNSNFNNKRFLLQEQQWTIETEGEEQILK